MKDFDINKIGKKMPYEAPDEKFFDNFTEELLSKVAPQPKKRFTLNRVLTPILGMAAAVAIILNVALRSETSAPAWNDTETLSQSVSESIDSYLSSLSDEELTYLALESSYSDDFFSILPNN